MCWAILVSIWITSKDLAAALMDLVCGEAGVRFDEMVSVNATGR